MLGLAPFLGMARKLPEINSHPLASGRVEYFMGFKFVHTALISQRVVEDLSRHCFLVQTTAQCRGEKWDSVVPFDEMPTRRERSQLRGNVYTWCRGQGWIPVFA